MDGVTAILVVSIIVLHSSLFLVLVKFYTKAINIVKYIFKLFFSFNNILNISIFV